MSNIKNIEIHFEKQTDLELSIFVFKFRIRQSDRLGIKTFLCQKNYS